MIIQTMLEGGGINAIGKLKDSEFCCCCCLNVAFSMRPFRSILCKLHTIDQILLIYPPSLLYFSLKINIYPIIYFSVYLRCLSMSAGMYQFYSCIFLKNKNKKKKQKTVVRFSFRKLDSSGLKPSVVTRTLSISPPTLSCSVRISSEILTLCYLELWLSFCPFSLPPLNASFLMLLTYHPNLHLVAIAKISLLA